MFRIEYFPLFGPKNQSNALFEQQQQHNSNDRTSGKKRLLLIIQLDDVNGCKDFTCVVPLTNEYDMIRDDCLYNVFDKYISFVYATNSQENSNKQIYQLAFSCLPLLNGYSISVEVHENIFAKYFKRASFVQEKSNITNLYRIYTLKCILNWPTKRLITCY